MFFNQLWRPVMATRPMFVIDFYFRHNLFWLSFIRHQANGFLFFWSSVFIRAIDSYIIYVLYNLFITCIEYE